MADKWNREHHNIGVKYEGRIVRIINDEALLAYFRRYGRKGARSLAAHIRKKSEALSGTELPITEKSLAAEIYYHFRILRIFLKIEKVTGRKRFPRWMIRHMDVIDCGGRKEDNNRFLWDILSVFW